MGWFLKYLIYDRAISRARCFRTRQICDKIKIRGAWKT
ncbi:hypothetical Protein YC6258_01666 [Gynuella sunshinyii YC6258]|uniref:Uncharacterized protein n=1 Tax=Gynuella sunshinyii YC6258 TaxID=1445510 RepID=A0A0C5VTR8_9GAMM|nr:hypothetical Protein YC6258_01666 [Gynuella sunshinyii YC6258]